METLNGPLGVREWCPDLHTRQVVFIQEIYSKLAIHAPKFKINEQINTSGAAESGISH